MYEQQQRTVSRSSRFVIHVFITGTYNNGLLRIKRKKRLCSFENDYADLSGNWRYVSRHSKKCDRISEMQSND